MPLQPQNLLNASRATASDRLQLLRLRGDAILRQLAQLELCGTPKQTHSDASKRKSFNRPKATKSKSCQESEVMLFSSPQEALQKLASGFPTADNVIHSI
eukprot:TRINITY_DN24213_c0_g1_i1.p1 TRINITY_DN24213_c0_g1~~TRINITY_DN24213_c0_g1_i1.p1  ORF type:complete len:100 (-),score=9.45 TRINITY_DN24213_c0_g1_i1:329-628(-)